MKILLIIACCFAYVGIGTVAAKKINSVSVQENSTMIHEKMIQRATFAGGCFWCMEKTMRARELKPKLTPMQYEVTQNDGTEPPFNNQYWDNKKQGIYVDIVSNEPLFSSTEKYESGTGWPSFTRPLVKDNIVEKEDWQLFSVRTEVRSKNGDSHLGHVFKDGPPPEGLRYCLNSASLRFIPVDKLEEEGYGRFLKLFHN